MKKIPYTKRNGKIYQWVTNSVTKHQDQIEECHCIKCILREYPDWIEDEAVESSEGKEEEEVRGVYSPIQGTFAEHVLRELSNLWIFCESLAKARPIDEGGATRPESGQTPDRVTPTR